MDNKNTGLIATLVAVVLCGCPGLFLCLFGSISTLAGAIPGSNIDINGSSDPAAAMTMGIVLMCLSVIMIAIPVGVGFYTMRKKPAAVSNEPLPPAS